MTLPEAIARGARHFDAGEFFEAHEAWEDHWGKGSPEERALTLALIKAAVALHHLRAGNLAGFAWQGERAVTPLREHASVWPDLPSAALADAIETLLAQTRFHRAAPTTLDVPRLSPTPSQ